MSENSYVFKFNDKSIKCFIVNGAPWFKCHDVATILGYYKPRNAIRDHIPEKFQTNIRKSWTHTRQSSKQTYANLNNTHENTIHTSENRMQDIRKSCKNI